MCDPSSQKNFLGNDRFTFNTLKVVYEKGKDQTMKGDPRTGMFS